MAKFKLVTGRTQHVVVIVAVNIKYISTLDWALWQKIKELYFQYWKKHS